MTIQEIAKDIWKINDVDSNVGNVYLINKEVPTIIDTGDDYRKKEIKTDIEKIIPINQIKQVLFTHLHHDHIENADLFKNATFYASKEAIKTLNEDPLTAYYGSPDKTIDILKKYKINLKELPFNISGLKVIETPGHTKGSVCFYNKEEKILFSGDHIFDKEQECVGRSDFPNSDPEKYSNSLNKTKCLDIKILGPGHDYER